MEPIKKVFEKIEKVGKDVMGTEEGSASSGGSSSRGDKIADLEQNRVYLNQENVITTNFGTKITNTVDSLKVGERGPVIMDDFHFREKITHFDHERIPERVVHARGSGAHGYFQVYESQESLTKADFLCHPEKKTPVFVRFSTVLGSKGSADTVRDVRGFATKFYTDEGIFDLVGNNIPVFFIQDAIKFPDMVHSGKPEPDKEIPQAQTAHDNFWDFISLTPESTHMALWILSDRTIPRSFRMMQGFGVHTFLMVNKDGKRRFVKFHWTPILGTHSLVWDEAQKISGVDPDFHRRDLYEAIAAGQFPEYELALQIVEEADENKFDFDLLDSTKIIPEELAPLRRIGKMVLNRNPDNFFAETEQVAFHIGHLVPGIEPTNDPLLQGRLFSYTDTQLLRLGGPNFEQIPINRPLCPVTNNQRDGFHQSMIYTGKMNYFPNRFGCPAIATSHQGGYAHQPTFAQGEKIRARSAKFSEFYSQGRLFYNSLSWWEKEHLIKAATFEIGKCDDLGVRQRMVNVFGKVDFDLATKLAMGIGVNPPQSPENLTHTFVSSPLSQDITSKKSILSRRIAFLVGPGFDFSQLIMLQKYLLGAGAMCFVIGPFKGQIPSSEVTSGTKEQPSTSTAQAQFSFLTAKSVLFDGVVVVGGARSIDTLRMNGEAMNFVCEAFKHCKPVIAINEGADFLEFLRLPGIKIADTGAHCEQGVVTFRGGADTFETAMNLQTGSFGKMVFQAIAVHRHHERDVTRIPA